MKRLLLALCLIGASHACYKHYYVRTKPGQAHHQVIVYSLTTCGSCKLLTRQLKAANIKFNEFFIDTDADADAEIRAKLAYAGLNKNYVGTPTLDVKGVIMPNNPPLSEIKKRL